MSNSPMPNPAILKLIGEGVVVPACPLALDEDRQWSRKHQRALLRYYAAAGAGGVAVGVHTTQFAIRDPEIGLFEPVLRLAAEEMDALSRRHGRPLIKVAGVCGRTDQAMREAALAASLGYDAALLSLGALPDASDEQLLDHCRAVGREIALWGFYLQPSVGGRPLGPNFWREFAAIPNVVAIKIAPFNRYQTLDVVRAVALSDRENRIALYTGNDDNIILDLLTPYPVRTEAGEKTLRIRGGLLGQWAVWTRRAVRMLEAIHEIVDSNGAAPVQWLQKNIALTDANAAIFDAAHGFAGCVPGINEVLRRQGLLPSRFCLDPREVLSPGQAEAIDRVARDYPELTDDDFVERHREEWLDG